MRVLLTEINRFTAFGQFIAAPKLETDRPRHLAQTELARRGCISAQDVDHPERSLH
ncbi:hypothetical protein NKI44_18665 [Mesorhizobium sp. M0614]|uniref:hypothetical protein n=1 Tax=Mesorhizobium sp. M0614 TaxID=2956970 RepID=UPI003335E04A